MSSHPRLRVAIPIPAAAAGLGREEPAATGSEAARKQSRKAFPGAEARRDKKAAWAHPSVRPSFPSRGRRRRVRGARCGRLFTLTPSSQLAGPVTMRRVAWTRGGFRWSTNCRTAPSLSAHPESGNRQGRQCRERIPVSRQIGLRISHYFLLISLPENGVLSPLKSINLSTAASFVRGLGDSDALSRLAEAHRHRHNGDGGRRTAPASGVGRPDEEVAPESRRTRDEDDDPANT
ncbi:hypothetical protein PAHAL_9G475000 [Panicum hallii]|jgi:hypothetical protein|uniref:Uncharacterized protein n=1 Tax=Panicum hallii TaxID=206008 RepID=A0A2T8I4Z6_9POAL|nr:hypothetical protein PAHAL_9G475000 [Panicum hallii]